MCALALVAAPLAHADIGDYASHSWPGCNGGFNSGSWDDAGLVYVPCGNPSTIGVYDEAGTLVRSIPTGRFVSDVAPTRDGRFLYLAGPGAPARLARQDDGSYAADPTWAPQQYVMWGSSRFTPSGYFVATDAAGNVYVADGTWGTNLTHAVVKYDSTGAVVTHFGEWDKSWELGTFYWALGGLAVSGDGATVYTVELGNNRVQRWTHTADGIGYSVKGAADVLGSTAASNPDRAGYCDFAAWRGTLAAPYDVALDGDDNLYVINTTCKQVLSFEPDFGPMRANLDVHVAGGDYPRPHGFAVGRDGTVYVGENQRVLRPAGGAAPAPAPAPAPVPVPLPDPVPNPDPVLPDPVPDITPRLVRPVEQHVRRDLQAPVVRISAATTTRASRRTMRVSVRCSERCRVDVTARQGRRIVGRRIAWLRPGRARPMTTRITPRAHAGRIMLHIRIRDHAGNTVTYRRTARR